MTELEILEAALRCLSQSLDNLVEACVDLNNKPKAPTLKALAQARACLPPYCENAFKSKVK